jgi:transcriptional regulator with XRE-family HTH domain
MMETQVDKYVPHEVVSLMVDNEWSIVRAWREHLGLTQQTVSERLNISQSAYAQQEANVKLRKTSHVKIAAALGIAPEHLDV